MNCLHCQQPTPNPKFCSRSCAAKHTNKTPKRKLSRTCHSCNTLVRSGYKYCSVCYSKRQPVDITLAEAIYTEHHKSSAFALVRSRARAATKHREQRCEMCPYDKHVEVAHVKSISSFSFDTKISVINAEDNLRLLCPNCHWEFDH